MSILDLKITSYEGKDVASAPDTLDGSPSENKAVFDAVAKEIIVPKFNGLIDEIASTLSIRALTTSQAFISDMEDGIYYCPSTNYLCVLYMTPTSSSNETNPDFGIWLYSGGIIYLSTDNTDPSTRNAVAMSCSDIMGYSIVWYSLTNLTTPGSETKTTKKTL